MSGNPAPASGGGSFGSQTGGSSPAGFGTGGGAGDTCIFTFTTMLGSPVPAQVAEIQVGAWLRVAVQDDPPAVTVVRGGGALVGGITQSAALLRSCIQQGYEYLAEVRSINGGAVEVEIRPA